MCTSNIFFSLVIFLPWHSLHLSLGLIRSPWPWHSLHSDCICWMKPGASCCMRICIPLPRQLRHVSTAPSFPPRPATQVHNESITEVLTKTRHIDLLWGRTQTAWPPWVQTSVCVVCHIIIIVIYFYNLIIVMIYNFLMIQNIVILEML